VTAASAVGALELGRRGSSADPGSLVQELAVRVVARGTARPIPGARVSTVHLEREQSTAPMTDREGRTRLLVPAGVGWEGLSLRVRREGFVPLARPWNGVSREGARADVVIEMEPGVPIGGTVIGPEGQPLRGSIVRVSASGKPGQERADLLEEPYETDQDGRWRCGVAPADPGVLRFRIQHHDGLEVSFASRPADKLLDESDVVRLERGLRIEGRVFDPAGQPLAGATIIEGAAIMKCFPERRIGLGSIVQSSADGAFRFDCARAGDVQLTVTARGCAPLLVRTIAGGSPGILEVRLEPGRAISGRVVNHVGEPIGGARVEASFWLRTANLDWGTTTDEQGRFAWNEAPVGAVSLSAWKRGYVMVSNREALPDGREVVFVLDAVPRLRGKVLDATTGAPLERFAVTRGYSNGGPAQWEARSFELAGGEYDVVFPSPRSSHAIRIEAAGYLPGVSRAFGGDEGCQTLDVRLETGKAVRGTVTNAKGQAVEGAEVLVLSPARSVEMVDGKIVSKELAGSAGAVRDFDRARTGAGGVFSLNPQESGLGLLVMHSSGFALFDAIDPARPLAVTLEPWGRVEGELRLAGRGVEGEKVALVAEPRPGRLRCTWSATTSAGGRFAFDGVPAGEARLTHEVEVASGPRGRQLESTRAQLLRVAPGKTVSAVIGGAGRAVTGRVVKAAASTGDADWSSGFVHLARREQDGGTASHVTYATRLEKDGSFRMDDVVPGVHGLWVEVLNRAASSSGGAAQETASLHRDVEVADVGRDAPPLDLGAIEVAVHRELIAGAPAPTFTVRTTDGKDVKLEDYRGKVVLLDFWATWCGPCVGLTPDLKELHAAFQKDGGFAILGLSLDEDPEAPKAFAAKHRLPWVQGLLGKWEESQVRAEYGVAGIPSLVLVGRDGRIIAKGLMGAQGLKSLVAGALARKEGP
jgi:peroxiredoxin